MSHVFSNVESSYTDEEKEPQSGVRWTYISMEVVCTLFAIIIIII